MSKRRRFTADFKAKVALDAFRGDKTTHEIAAQIDRHGLIAPESAVQRDPRCVTIY